MNIDMLIDQLEEKNASSKTIANIKNYCLNLQNNNLPLVLDIEHLRRLIGVSKNKFYPIIYGKDWQYNKQVIFKKNQIDQRELLIPSENLKIIQRWVLKNILYKNDCHAAAHGFILKKSIVSNAQPHVNQDYIYKLDIKDFFPSITQKKVYTAFENMGYTKKICLMLTSICTYQGSDYGNPIYDVPILPQGAPTSPYLSNLVCKSMDASIKDLCDRNYLRYTRYADDITISGKKIAENFKLNLAKIIEFQGFETNKNKTKLVYKKYRQSVTGITVNDKISVDKKINKYLRQEIHFIKKFGIYDHLKHKGKENKSNYKGHLFGIASYINMVDPVKGAYYLEELRKIDFTY